MTWNSRKPPTTLSHVMRCVSIQSSSFSLQPVCRNKILKILFVNLNLWHAYSVQDLNHLRWNASGTVGRDATRDTFRMVARLINRLSLVCKVWRSPQTTALQLALYNVSRPIIGFRPALFNNIRNTCTQNAECDDAANLRRDGQHRQEEELFRINRLVCL